MKTDNLIFFNKEAVIRFIKHNKAHNIRLLYYDKAIDHTAEIKRLETKLNTLVQRDSLKRKKYIKCRRCTSKISTFYTRLTFKTIDGIRVSECLCPVCGAELRKHSLIRKQNKLVRRIKELQGGNHIKVLYG